MDGTVAGEGVNLGPPGRINRWRELKDVGPSFESGNGSAEVLGGKRFAEEQNVSIEAGEIVCRATVYFNEAASEEHATIVLE